MPKDLRPVYERNDDVLGHIYLGRRFKHDSERLKNCSSYTSRSVCFGCRLKLPPRARRR